MLIKTNDHFSALPLVVEKKSCRELSTLVNICEGVERFTKQNAMGNFVKVITGGTLIDGTGSPPLEDAVVVIEGAKIVRVGGSGKVTVPAGADVIHANGRTIMPGLIDCHTHISDVSTASAATGWGVLELSHSDRAVMAVVAARKLLEAGITTIRDLGDAGLGSPTHITVAVRDAIRRGDIVGPRIFSSDSGITITGGHADMLKSVRALATLGRGLGYGMVDGVTECVKLVREQVRVGADQIKIWATGGVMEVSDRAGTQELSDEEITAIVKEANRFGIFVAAHAVGPPKTISFCSEAGVRSIEHGVFSDQESIDMMKKKGTFLVPTLIAYQLLTKEGFPAVTREVANRAVKAHENTLRMAKDTKVKIAMGTDSGDPFGSIHGKSQSLELELMTQRGLTEMESIIASTRNGAECIGIGEKVGTLEAGKFADLLIVDGNPLHDIRILQDLSRIKTVMREGVPFVTRS